MAARKNSLANFGDLNDSSPAVSPHAETEHREDSAENGVQLAPLSDGKLRHRAATSGQRAAKHADPATQHDIPEGVREALDAELPDTAAEPRIVIAACDRRIRAAQTLRYAMERQAGEALFHFAGPAVRLAHTTEAWRHLTDPDTGKPYRSFSAWLRAVAISPRHAYRMLKAQPVAEALADLTPAQLQPRQIDILFPVLKTHGEEKLRELWTAAHAAADTSPAALSRLRDVLGLQADEDEAEEDEAPRTQAAPVLRFQVTPGTFDATLVRNQARAQPNIARLIAKTILAELGEDDR